MEKGFAQRFGSRALSAYLMGTVSLSLVAIAAPSDAQAETALEGIIVTATRTNEAAIDALAGSSSVISEQLDQQFNPESVADVLRTVPGVTTQETARDTGVAVNIRGLQDFGRVNVLIDGVRQNFQRSGHSSNGVVYIEPEMISSIDVTKGPTATVYGSGAIGGVAQFNLLSADDILRDGETSAIEVKGRHASNGSGHVGSAAGAIRVGNFDIVAQVIGRKTNNLEDGDGNEIPYSDSETDSKLIKARWRPLDGHEVTGTFVDFDTEFTDRIEPLEGTRRATVADNKQFSLGYTFDSPTNDLIDFDGKIYSNRTRLDQTRLDATSTERNAFAGGPPQTVLGLPFPGVPQAVSTPVFLPAGATRSVEVQTIGFDVFNTSRGQFGDTKLAFTYGVDGFRDRVESIDLIDNQDEFTPGGERTLSGGFLQAKFTFFDMVDVIGAVRYDDYELNGNGVNVTDDNISPKLTVGVTPLKGITLFATYAEGFRAPAPSETLTSGLHPPPADFIIRPNPLLRPELSANIEGGVNLKFDDVFQSSDAFRMKVVGFRNEIEDYIEGVSTGDVEIGVTCPNAFGAPCTPADIVPIFGGQTFQFQNLNSVLIEGVELEAAYDAGAWFAAVGAHHIRGRDEVTKEGLRSIPADQITLTTGFRAFDDKLVAGTRTRFVANQERFTPLTAALAAFARADGYAVVDLFGEYQVNDNAKVNLNVDNVFDKQYRQHLDQDNSPGLNARVGLTMRLGSE